MAKPSVPPFFLLTCFLSCVAAQEAVRRPNILFVLMDDLGYNDVGYRDSQFHTPFIDELHSNAVRFDSSYTPPNCGASRAALLSGVYPHKLGLQGNAINSRSSAAIPLSKTILPQKLQELGYQTHLVGKWHQGFCKKQLTPNYRGFDSFFGFYLTKQDHFSHIGKKNAYDFRTNLDVNTSLAVQGKYSTHIYSEEVRRLVREYKESCESSPNETKPFFIMLSHAAIHGPNQVPTSYINGSCASIPNVMRQKKCGMMAAVDEGLRNITNDLREMGMMDNLLIIFTSDDGGKTDEGSSNWPLRGAKRTLWEGGIRVNTFMYSESREILPKTNYNWRGLFYNTDFYATLVGLIEDKTEKKLPKIIDSFNHWSMIKNGKGRGHRRSIAYVDQNLGVAMYRDKNWKLLYRQSRYPGWYNPPANVATPPEPKRSSLPEYQLFDLNADPTESYNLKEDKVGKFNVLLKKLTDVRAKAKPPTEVRLDSHPSRFNGVWSYGWCNGL